MTVLKEEFSNKLGRLFSLSLRIKQEYEYLTENMDCTHARDILERKYFNRANGKHDESFYLTVTASLDFLIENRFPEGGLASAVPMTETDIVFVNEENMVSPVKFTQRSHSVYPFEPLILRLSKRNLFETNDGFHYPYFDHLSKNRFVILNKGLEKCHGILSCHADRKIVKIQAVFRFRHRRRRCDRSISWRAVRIRRNGRIDMST